MDQFNSCCQDSETFENMAFFKHWAFDLKSTFFKPEKDYMLTYSAQPTRHDCYSAR